MSHILRQLARVFVESSGVFFPKREDEEFEQSGSSMIMISDSVARMSWRARHWRHISMNGTPELKSPFRRSLPL